MPNGSDSEYLGYVHGHVTGLRRTAYLLCGDRHHADDLVQETLTKLYAKWSRMKNVDNVDAYVQTVLVRTYLDERRRGWWRVMLHQDVPEGSSVNEIDPAMRSVVRVALAQLPPRQRAVLVLRYMCDQPVLRVAELMGSSEGTVKSQAAHGLTKLRKLLGDLAPQLALTHKESTEEPN